MNKWEFIGKELGGSQWMKKSLRGNIRSKGAFCLYQLDRTLAEGSQGDQISEVGDEASFSYITESDN